MVPAKIIKITGYFICPNMDDAAFCRESEERLNPESIQEILGDYFDVIPKHFKLEDRDIEWDDDCALNNINCPVEECEKYF